LWALIGAAVWLGAVTSARADDFATAAAIALKTIN
jgi:hypothetical protein